MEEPVLANAKFGDVFVLACGLMAVYSKREVNADGTTHYHELTVAGEAYFRVYNDYGETKEKSLRILCRVKKNTN